MIRVLILCAFLTGCGGGGGGAINTATAAPVSNTLALVILGDSMSAYNRLLGDPWPLLLARSYQAQGLAATVANLAVDGNTCQLQSVMSAEQKTAIAGASDILFALGAADYLFNIAGRQAQAAADCATLVAQLRVLAPAARITFVRMDHVDPATAPGYVAFENATVALCDGSVAVAIWKLDQIGLLMQDGAIMGTLGAAVGRQHIHATTIGQRFMLVAVQDQLPLPRGPIQYAPWDTFDGAVGVANDADYRAAIGSNWNG